VPIENPLTVGVQSKELGTKSGTDWEQTTQFKSDPRNHFAIDKAGNQDSGLFSCNRLRAIYCVAHCPKEILAARDTLEG
jgi:succinate dehydrogenase/fumarate reductase-like Fe-S protein